MSSGLLSKIEKLGMWVSNETLPVYIKKRGIIQSMTKKGNSYDNAVIKNFLEY